MRKMSTLVVLFVAVAAVISSPVLAKSRHSGRNAFDMVPASSSFADPALTGGGSTGYNEELPQRTG
jgi:hypothetical protein